MYRQQFPQLAARVSIRGRVESMRAFRVVSGRVTAAGAFVIAMTAFVCLTRHVLG